MKIDRHNLEVLRDQASAIVATCLEMVSPMKGAEDLSEVNPMVLRNLDLAESGLHAACIKLQDALDHLNHTPEEAAAWQKKHGY